LQSAWWLPCSWYFLNSSKKFSVIEYEGLVKGKKLKLRKHAFDFQEFCHASGGITLLVT
jgi:hypothetical protein